ncbi:hypothetical protein [Aneurinibacillus sp. Ricciae_BoGa-3]|uniref:hypothetical protein n=1 Tax=Aneurinibacillus sp. Ricciae_BoGa-3 TaxID=3022697 RepID=UPI003FA4C06E
MEDDGLGRILDALISSLNQRIARYNVEVKLDSCAKEFLLHKGFNRKFGARFLKRTVRKHVEIPLASYLAKRPLKGEQVILQLSREGTELKANTLIKTDAADRLVLQT